MLGPLGGEKIYVASQLKKYADAAQAMVNAQDKTAEEGGICYAYKYTMNNMIYVYPEDELCFEDEEGLNKWTSNGQVSEAFIARKEA